MEGPPNGVYWFSPPGRANITPCSTGRGGPSYLLYKGAT